MKFLQRLLILLLITPFYLLGQGEDNINYTSHAPSNNSLSSTKQKAVGVNFTNGAPVINIPLFNKTMSGVTVGVDLNYYSRGLKASEYASVAGLGWNLQAGGAITRVINGEPDELITHGYFDNRDEYQTYDGAPNNSPNYRMAHRDNPDAFHFNFLGRSGKLIFLEDPTGNEPAFGRIVTTPFQDLKITYQILGTNNGNLYTDRIGSFIITDERGIRYHFGDSWEIDPATHFQVSLPGTEHVSVGGYQCIQTWYLTRIELPNYEELFTFKYWDFDLQEYYTGDSKPLNKEIILPIYTQNNIGTSAINNIPPCPTGTVTSGRIIEKTFSRKNIMYLGAIHYKGGEYGFSYTSRLDEEHSESKAIESIYENNPYSHTNIRGFRFSYDYFQESPTSSNETRLKLTALTETGKGTGQIDNNSYEFTYYNENNVPSTKTAHIDPWGFLNSTMTSVPELDLFQKLDAMIPTFKYLDRSENIQTYVGNDRAPTNDIDIAKTGMLASVKYPNLGMTTFEYELNEASEKDFFDHINLTTSVKQNRLCGGVRVKKIIESSLIDNSAYIKSYDYENVNVNGDLTGISSGLVFNTKPILFRNTRTRKAGDNDAGGSNPYLCFGCNEEYINAFEVDPLTRSYADHMVYKTVTETIKSTNDVVGGKTIYYYDVYQQYPQFYQELIESVNYVKTTNKNYIPTLIEQKISPHIASFNYVSTLPSKKETYKYESQTYSLEKKIEYSYETVINSQISIDLLDVQLLVPEETTWQIQPPCYDYDYITGLSGTSNTNYPTLYKKSIITINPEIARLLEYEHQTVYDDLGEPTTSETKYSYDEYNQLIEERKSSSTDTYYFTKYFRVTDFNTPPLSVHTDMLNKNIHLPVIEKLRYSNNDSVFDGNEKILSGSYTVFGSFHNNILPQTNFMLTTSSPLDPTNISEFDDNGYDASFYKPTHQFLSYDNKRRLLKYKAEDGFIVSNKYSDDIDFELLIATCKNAEPDKVFYSSYIDDQRTEGGYSSDFSAVNIAINTSSSDSKTGFISTDLNLSDINQSNIPIGKYILSFWSKVVPSANPPITINGTAISILKQHVSIATATGWKLNYYVVDVTAISEITISGNELLDEIRMYPYDAQLTTYTYFDGGLIHTITDENSITTDYEYDGMYRLKMIKDGNGNIIEERKYHTVNLQDSNY
ncbi:MAG: hypothetical protein HRT73_01405 [Flavobacteriales bacterium]|nr:hypothetical protein [Flavobacteriales bacterium]